MVGLPVLAEARIVFRIDAIDVVAQTNAQSGLEHARLDHSRAPDQDGTRQTFVYHHLHGAQHALVFAFGVGDALVWHRYRFGRREDRAHEHAGLVDKARQLLAIGFHVLDRARGNAGLFSGFGDRRRNAQDQA